MKPKEEITFSVKADEKSKAFFDKLNDEYERAVAEVTEKLFAECREKLSEHCINASELSKEQFDNLVTLAQSFAAFGWNKCYEYHKERIEKPFGVKGGEE